MGLSHFTTLASKTIVDGSDEEYIATIGQLLLSPPTRVVGKLCCCFTFFKKVWMYLVSA